MKRFTFGLACILAMAPGVASAALRLVPVSAIGPGPIVPGGIPGELYLDLVFHETGTPTNEGWFAYDLYLQRDKPGINLDVIQDAHPRLLLPE